MNNETAKAVYSAVESATLSDILPELKTTNVTALREPGASGFGELLTRIDKTDLQHQTNVYTQLVHVETNSVVEQLRHRADMMRRRAEEFDAMADDYVKASNIAVKQAHAISGTHEAILTVLDEHAHIKPTRT